MWNHDDEARHLRERFTAVRNKAAWAREHQLPGGASMLSQHIHGHRPINLDAAIAYARGFGVSLAEISPRLAEQQAKASAVQPAAKAPAGEVKEPQSAPYLDPQSAIRAALETIERATRAATSQRQGEIRLAMLSLLEGIDVLANINRLCELLSIGNSSASSRRQRAA